MTTGQDLLSLPSAEAESDFTCSDCRVRELDWTNRALSSIVTRSLVRPLTVEFDLSLSIRL